MGRNEIRLRRHRMSSGRIAQHRNYSDIIARHERDVKIKHVTRVFIYFVLILVIILAFLFVRKWEKTHTEPKESTSVVLRLPDAITNAG
jgi:hypothetical protein